MDKMSWEDKQLAVVEGMLAGNVFDWGAKEVANLMETQDFGFKEAMTQLQGESISQLFRAVICQWPACS